MTEPTADRLFANGGGYQSTANRSRLNINPTALVLNTLDLLLETVILARFQREDGTIDKAAADRVIEAIRQEALERSIVQIDNPA